MIHTPVLQSWHLFTWLRIGTAVTLWKLPRRVPPTSYRFDAVLKDSFSELRQWDLYRLDTFLNASSIRYLYFYLKEISRVHAVRQPNGCHEYMALQHFGLTRWQ